MSVNPQARIVIRHLSGSKINQVEQIPLKDLQELTIGRDPSSNISYDPKRDDIVSRQHAAIRISQGEKLSFRLTDLNSSNGTLLNGEPVTGDVELAPEDVIELGRGGPKFSFDVEPRPDNLSARTRVFTPADASATRAIASAAATATGTAQLPKNTKTGTTGVIAKPSIGKETVMRLLFQERQKSSRMWMSSIAAAVAVLIASGGGLYWYNRNVANQLREEVRLADEIAKKARDEDRAKLGASAKDIITKYGNSTIKIYATWRVYDQGTGRPVFHKVYIDKSGNQYPAYVRLPNGTIVRWLTLEDQSNKNIGIKEEDFSGSGFVVTAQGLILTNKHVAAGWMMPFSEIGAGRNPKNLAFVFPFAPKDKNYKGEAVPLRELALSQRKWVPEEGGLIFHDKVPVPISGGLNDRRAFQGRNDYLEVRFPGNRVSLQANLVRASTDSDAALVKVETGQSLVPVELADDDKLEVAEKVIVLGYPGISSQTLVASTSVEGLGRVGNTRIEEVPEPTVSEGIVSLLGAGFKKEGDMTVIGTTGDAFQMTINSTGAGNSGGPVFNAKGQVVGLFTYGRHRDNDATISLAVPIKHGRALLNPQRTTSQ